jgi:hypothetical protein
MDVCKSAMAQLGDGADNDGDTMTRYNDQITFFLLHTFDSFVCPRRRSSRP